MVIFIYSYFNNLFLILHMYISKPGSSIDLILTNKPKSFQNSGVIETGISDHHALIFLFLKTTFTKMPPNKFQYRNYKKFEAHSFFQDVEQLPKSNYPGPVFLVFLGFQVPVWFL